MTITDIGDILHTVESFHATVFYGVPKMHEFRKEHEKIDRFELVARIEAFDNVKRICDLGASELLVEQEVSRAVKMAHRN